MTEAAVKTRLQQAFPCQTEEARERVWQRFLEWMTGQTVGVGADLAIDFYEVDVEHFCKRGSRAPVDD